MIKIYGIKNCDTIKKTLKWFDSQSVSYEFIDYKKTPPTKELAQSFLAENAWETVINKRGTTWRKLDETVKANMNAEHAIPLMMDQPSIIKRPIIESNNNFFVGYDEPTFKTFL